MQHDFFDRLEEMYDYKFLYSISSPLKYNCHYYNIIYSPHGPDLARWIQRSRQGTTSRPWAVAVLPRYVNGSGSTENASEYYRKNVGFVKSKRT